MFGNINSFYLKGKSAADLKKTAALFPFVDSIFEAADFYA